ncbi:polyphosphate--glucose phosphotransferase [Bifidobacterium aquikefiri]|uniref:polyphosphate--glucose phosphotransferase n=1 Tax=Bifidobacterium aquikefiri TaxID=1653207 RepID=UPI0023F13AAF|nr:ROK family protein [Bifidobacterium aquikefiri]
MIETAQAFGIDIGGSGIKGAPVDMNIGDIAEPRQKILTPEVSTPDAVGKVVKEMLDRFEVPDSMPVGIAFPAPIRPGKALNFMANLDKSWLGVDVQKALSDSVGRHVDVVNDADAAGLAEVQFGAAKGENGFVIATTLGTGIGSAMIYNGVLIPNSELGHLTLKGDDAEHYAAASVRENQNLGYKKWAKRLTRYYHMLETYFNPDLFVVGGGVSRMSDRFIPQIEIETPIVPAKLRNQAGIVGAAYHAMIHQD